MEDFFSKIAKDINKATRTIFNTVDSIANLQSRTVQSVFRSGDLELEHGDHIYIQNLGYTHHGIYIGNNRVIHYTKGYDEQPVVQTDSLDNFGPKSCLFKKASSANYTRDEIISRAYSKLGENGYNLIFNNCEHFVRWCRTGEGKGKANNKSQNEMSEYEKWNEAHRKYLRNWSR